MDIAVKHSYRFMKIHGIIFSGIMVDYKGQESLFKQKIILKSSLNSVKSLESQIFEVVLQLAISIPWLFLKLIF